MARHKLIDSQGNAIKSGARVEFDGTRLMGQHWIELGTMQFDEVRGWLFQPDHGDPHRAVTEFYPATKAEPAKLVFKYYRVIEQ